MSEPSTTLDVRFSAPMRSPPNGLPLVERSRRRSSSGSRQSRWPAARYSARRRVARRRTALRNRPDEQKALNLRGNLHVILMTGCNRWDDGVDVVVEGDAVRVADDKMLERLAEAWTSKWDGGGDSKYATAAFITNPERLSCSGLRPPRSSRSVRAPSARPVTGSNSRRAGNGRRLGPARRSVATPSSGPTLGRREKEGARAWQRYARRVTSGSVECRRKLESAPSSE
jgi:hypothetical protein